HIQSDDVLPGTERLLPHVVSQYDNARRSWRLIGVEQRATEDRRDTRGAEPGRRDLRHLDPLRYATVDDEIPGRGAERPDVLDGSQAASPFEEVARDAELELVRQNVARLNRDQTVAFGQRNRRRQELLTQVVPPRANRDRNGERQRAGNGQARVLHEHPESELVILQHVSSPESVAQVNRRARETRKNTQE